jgi:hypothetical protein
MSKHVLPHPPVVPIQTLSEHESLHRRMTRKTDNTPSPTTTSFRFKSGRLERVVAAADGSIGTGDDGWFSSTGSRSSRGRFPFPCDRQLQRRVPCSGPKDAPRTGSAMAG